MSYDIWLTVDTGDRVEACTTTSAKRRHYSIDLAAENNGMWASLAGRKGHSKCSEYVLDQDGIDAYYGLWDGSGAAPKIADLPECRRCAAKLAKENQP